MQGGGGEIKPEEPGMQMKRKEKMKYGKKKAH